MSENKLTTIKSKLQKIAAEIPQESAAPQDTAAPSSPQEILALVQEAIQILDTAAQGIPVPKEPAPAAAPVAAAKTDKDDEDEEEKEQMASLKQKVAVLEKENTDIKKAEVAEKFANLYPQEVRQSKYDELVKEENLDILTAKFNAAKDISESSSTQKPTYTPVKSQSGYLKQASIIPEWRF
jgi:hypothetical protein